MILIQNINHRYINQKNGKFISIFNNFSMSIPDGEVVSLVGPSGCGKTTLVDIIAGYQQPTSGHIVINNKSYKKPNKKRIVVNQNYDLFDWMTVYQNMKLVCKNENEIKKYLALCNLEGFDHHYPNELSGGMKKRLSIARALSVNPTFLIMDEPFSSLDYQLREKLQNELLRIVTTTNKTVLFVTHDIDEAIFLSDRIIILSDKQHIQTNEFIIKLNKNKPMIRETNEFLQIKKQIKKKLSDLSL